MLAITTLRKIDLHPVNYFFLAASFFAFSSALRYLVTNSIGAALRDSSAVDRLFLTISYLRLVVGWRLPPWRAGSRSSSSRLVFVRIIQRRLERLTIRSARSSHCSLSCS